MQEYAIRIPVDMYQFTDKNGTTWPIAFVGQDVDGFESEVKIDRVKSVSPLAEQRSGTVGDRYECEIGGETVYIYYTKLTPRKWFKILPCSLEEYNAYYKLKNEKNKSEWNEYCMYEI